MFVWFKTQGTKRAKSDGNGVNHTGGCGGPEVVGKGIRKRMNRSFRTGCFMSWTFGEGQLVSDWFLVLRVVSGGFGFVSGLGREELCHDLGRSGNGVLFFQWKKRVSGQTNLFGTTFLFVFRWGATALWDIFMSGRDRPAGIVFCED